MPADELAISRLSGANQNHILALLEHGSEENKVSLSNQVLNELSHVNFHHFNDVLRDSLELAKTGAVASVVEPPPKDFLFDVSSPALRRAQVDRITRLEMLGYKAIHVGQVAFLILAGGSGTRLGFDKPKGLFVCSELQSPKSLFMIYAEKIRKRQELADAHFQHGKEARIPLLIMTSDQNDEETRNFFEENAYFGLVKEQVYFFKQMSTPCYEEETGKIIMESRGRICAAPGGNGAVFSALAAAPTKPVNCKAMPDESVLDCMQRLGVRYIQIGNVDNLVAKIADPLFVGYAIEQEAHVVVKTCPKISADERVGVFARLDGGWGVVEYTEIGDRAKEVCESTGELKFNCANISCNICSLPFLRLAAGRMKTFTQYHVARKKIPSMKGPVMGIKLEAFIFDLFRFADECDHPPKENGAFRIMQVNRNEEFAPIKNADGAASDTPKDAVRLMLNLHTQWLLTALESAAMSDNKASRCIGIDATESKAAVTVMRKRDIKAEISPLVSSEGEGLTPYLPRVIHQLLHESRERIVIRRDEEVVPEPSSL
ncbi:putative UDP-N-acetylglucosamine pyrophosphorylase [Trypanosoma vivax]|uniref:UDP-N-acetylglucosamine diphosphorylase n=1 Tax=Trypanosoma vivax (strain Y486) TaxID=1055687 RepID=G0UAE0_TRYVY|nr:putative UDP-N-acetylglucosamine pyrophosphorylase [Trypanosoma vivax]CCC52773.1 putative UDP-N-acetylglucosamine pyrophosphorylase [Trypanosoma vivax Y486]